jgi:hypothetical protein
MQARTALLAAVTVFSAAGLVGAQGPTREMSPSGTSSAQVSGRWVKSTSGQTFAFGNGTFQDGKWIDISYGRPLLRSRDPWGTGDAYGGELLIGAKIWRAGANRSTQLTTTVPILIGDKRLAPGKYTVFIDLKQDNWTLVLSSLTAQDKYDPNDKTNVWGGYNYVPTKDVARMKMKLEKLPHKFEQLSWEFMDMTNGGGTLAMMWDNVLASVSFVVL